jgi:hypothetical protein
MKEEGRRKKEEGRRKKEEGRGKREEGRFFNLKGLSVRFFLLYRSLDPPKSAPLARLGGAPRSQWLPLRRGTLRLFLPPF